MVEAPDPAPDTIMPAAISSIGRSRLFQAAASDLARYAEPEPASLESLAIDEEEPTEIETEGETPDPGSPPPTIQQPDDPPHLDIRSAEPAPAMDIQSLRELPQQRPPPPLEALVALTPTAVATPRQSAPSNLPASLPQPARFLVGEESGRAVVSRLHARGPGGLVVMLPDGSLGWPSGEVPTDRPFVPCTMKQLSQSLRLGPFRGFSAVERKPYLLLTQGSEAFARDAADLLEGLYQDLIDCLEEGDIPVSQPEFPLVVIIYRDEETFRAHRRVDPDVRAYYEITTNRIILFESSEQDGRAPELAALRRPQTIAHEGVHQILQNVGVQPRLSDWPPWLVEGLAEYFAPASMPGETLDAESKWGNYGRCNFGRVNPFHMATLIDLQDPAALLSHFRGPGPDQISPSWARLGPEEPWVTHLMVRGEFSPTDYALSWSLTHYLATNHTNAFRSYLMTLRSRPPLEPRAPIQHLEDFVNAFGIQPSTLARRIDRHLASLRYKRVPFYAVRFEQAMGAGLTRRGVLVSPSPTMISQWLQAQSLPESGPMVWWATPFDSRNQAQLASENWLRNPAP